MGMGKGFEQKNLINIELKQGQELANQLKEQLDSPKRSGETCEFLAATILSSFEKALLMLKSSALKLEDDSMLNSPHSFTSDASPRSKISDEPHKNAFKKRKAMAQWSEQVEHPLGTGVEDPPGDEFNWRKYGQKNILGATFPRSLTSVGAITFFHPVLFSAGCINPFLSPSGEKALGDGCSTIEYLDQLPAYYRCTYRNSQGCLATKQVQRSDESLSLQVNYKGKHTCKKGSASSAGSASCGNEEKRHKIQKQNVEKSINFGACRQSKELGKSIEFERLPSFSFPSTIDESAYEKNHSYFEDTRENRFINSIPLQSFINQETSECGYLSLSPYHHSFEIGQNLPSSESGLTEILSAPNSVTNSPIGDFDLSLDPVDFDPNFPLDILEFFS